MRCGQDILIKTGATTFSMAMITVGIGTTPLFATSTWR